MDGRAHISTVTTNHGTSFIHMQLTAVAPNVLCESESIAVDVPPGATAALTCIVRVHEADAECIDVLARIDSHGWLLGDHDIR